MSAGRALSAGTLNSNVCELESSSDRTTDSFLDEASGSPSGGPLAWVVGVGLFFSSLLLYVSRMAPSVVPGDPGEYQLVAARWGIGHPPGYGLYA